tara:strand:+ start:781 stop:948 length:168 start_codon:yes stop_codon:yes gene_type:complete
MFNLIHSTFIKVIYRELNLPITIILQDGGIGFSICFFDIKGRTNPNLLFKICLFS